MKQLRQGLVLTFAVLGLSSCSLFHSSKPELDKPKPLAAVKNEYQIKPLWSHRVGKKVSRGFVRFDPVYADKKVYTADQAGIVSATDSRNGKLVWQRELDHQLTAGPAVGNKHVAVIDNKAFLTVLDSNSGKTLWQKKVLGEVLASPTISGNKLLVKTLAGSINAYNLANGQQVWSYQHQSPKLVLRAESSVRVADGTVIAGFSDGQAAGLALSDGRLLWEDSVTPDQGVSPVEQLHNVDADPITADGVVYLGSYQGAIAAITLNGEPLWQHELSVYSGIDFASPFVFASAADGQLWALDARDGQVAWRQPALLARGPTAPAVMGATVVVGDKSGFLHWLSQQDGHVVARQRASDASIVGRPLVVDNTVIAFSADGTLAAFNLS